MSDGIEFKITDRRSAQLLKMAGNAKTLDEANAALAALENYTRLCKLEAERTRDNLLSIARSSTEKPCA